LARSPKGYRGIGHETVGSDILAVLKVCTLPRAVLGADLTARLSDVKPDGWYPIQLLLDAMEVMADRVGYAGLLQMGYALFRLSHEERARASLKSAGDLVYGVDAMYHHANRGKDIGGWKVLGFGPGMARLEKTTPHHCWMEEGLLAEAFKVLGIAAFVRQSACFRTGAEACIYEIASVVRDDRWMGKHPPVG
jgi:hypothetical protein